MRDHRPQSNSELIDAINKDIRTKASFLSSLNKEIYQILPHIEHICRVANYRKGILVLECASSAWAMRLNYERQLLLTSLRKNTLTSLISIEIKINPDLAKEEINRLKKFVPTKASISEQSADFLLSLAAGSSDKIASRLKEIAKFADNTKPND